MIYNIIFDLDGVLFDGSDLHANLFLEALHSLSPELQMTRECHDSELHALTTRQKLKKLGIEPELSDKIYKLKQELTATKMQSVPINKKVMELCVTLTSRGYNIFCVSNSVRSTVVQCLSGMGVIDYFSGIISNEDTKEPKPSPEPYLTLFRVCNLNAKECMIVEDSPCGLESATKSGAHILPVKDCDDVTLQKILQAASSLDDSSHKEHHPSRGV
jgi:beta-phosphoglucomutase